jgi:Coenzyme PQQ synthesis protein D (PqqD)
MLSLFRKTQHKPPQKAGPDPLGFRVAPDVKASVHPDGVVLIHAGSGSVFSANRVGAMIWNGAAERRSLNQLTASISSEFHVPPQIVQQDATEFLAQLAAAGLLVADAS